MARDLATLARLLKQRGFTHKRSLGQHFLFDPSLLRQVVEVAELDSQDFVLEVGTGPGTLTHLMLDCAKGVVGVEIDQQLAAFLAEVLGEHEGFQLICGDVLASKHKLDDRVVDALKKGCAAGGRVKCVSNFPYAVATPVIVALLAEHARAQGFTLTSVVGVVQRELADRLTAKPGTKDYGPASVLVQTLGDVERVRDIAAGAFRPPPKVGSSLIRVRVHEVVPPLVGGERWQVFDGLVSKLFRFRRKTVRKAMVLACPDDLEVMLEVLRAHGVDPSARVEAIAPDLFVRLAAVVRA